MRSPHLASAGRERRSKTGADTPNNAGDGLQHEEAKKTIEEGWDSATGGVVPSKIWRNPGAGDSWVPSIRPSKTVLSAVRPEDVEKKNGDSEELVQQWKETWGSEENKRSKEERHLDAEESEQSFNDERISAVKSEQQPGPSLAQLRAEVDSKLRQAACQPLIQEVLRDNARRSLELQHALSELEDSEASEIWLREVSFWRHETRRLKAYIDEQQRLEEQAAAARSVKAEDELRMQILAEAMAASLAERQLAELENEQACCAEAAEEAEFRNVKLQQSLEQNAALGRGGGTAHLFVAALPGLDAAALEFAQRALEDHLQQLALKDPT